jgi:hypothetical protein
VSERRADTLGRADHQRPWAIPAGEVFGHGVIFARCRVVSEMRPRTLVR